MAHALITKNYLYLYLPVQLFPSRMARMYGIKRAVHLRLPVARLDYSRGIADLNPDPRSVSNGTIHKSGLRAKDNNAASAATTVEARAMNAAATDNSPHSQAPDGKEAEVAMKKEVADARREIENLRKAEMTAKDRVAELEEALREEGMALENARADVELLRAEVAVSIVLGVVCLS